MEPLAAKIQCKCYQYLQNIQFSPFHTVFSPPELQSHKPPGKRGVAAAASCPTTDHGDVDAFYREMADSDGVWSSWRVSRRLAAAKSQLRRAERNNTGVR
jgi:hypothetical protein